MVNKSFGVLLSPILVLHIYIYIVCVLGIIAQSRKDTEKRKLREVKIFGLHIFTSIAHEL